MFITSDKNERIYNCPGPQYNETRKNKEAQNDVKIRCKRQILSDVLANALLPGMVYGRGV